VLRAYHFLLARLSYTQVVGDLLLLHHIDNLSLSSSLLPLHVQLACLSFIFHVQQVVGDLSFLHDINGLSLLRAGEARPPLTVVLVNNGGGGIFSFLPIAGALPEQQFTQLWATPQNVDLEGLCVCVRACVYVRTCAYIIVMSCSLGRCGACRSSSLSCYG